ncbi:MAG: PSD1 and planctomycete cytochrome C domain-containing protein [Bryobacteraceae bacterium]|nr:PSD1 and planctomycete cytochrome C domain-containing protein [Bryobacteraceae bacterium]
MLRFLLFSALSLTTVIAQPVDFIRDVQPIFAKSCLSCHGEKSQQAGLRLDAKALAFAGGQSGKAILPGQAGDSPLYQRVAGVGEQARMPMGGKALPADQVEILKRWIEQGANWPDAASASGAAIKKHWAFVAPVRAPLPAVKNLPWVRTPIDRFILAKLEHEGLSPSSIASKTTLLRRLSLDLTGLPPAIDEIDAFLRDPSPRAYEKQVDRLLASPHYGERWGRHWLDAARYADSDGFEKDKQRSVWFYRDWVINALNRDLPYNRFLIEQLAGDLLPNATQEQKVATGFLRNSMINEEGGVDPEQFRMESMFDRMEAIGKGMLGVTIQCAQCHNHKFDPITQEEYYKIFAFLNNSSEGSLAVYGAEEEMQRANLFRKIREIENELQHRTPDWKSRMAKWEASVKDNQPNWVVPKVEIDDISTGGQKYIPQPDGSVLAAGYAPTKFRVKFTITTKDTNIRAFRLELMNDPNLPLGGPGRSSKGTGALTEFEVEIAPASNPKQVRKIKVASATADLNLPERELDAAYYDKSTRRRVTGPIDYAIDGSDDTAWGIDAGPYLRNQPRKAVFVLAEPIGDPNGLIIDVYLKQNHGGWNSDDNQNHNLGRTRLTYTTSEAAQADPLPAKVRELLGQTTRTPQQDQLVFNYWRTLVPEWSEASRQIDELWRQHPESESQLVLAERGDMRQTNLLLRGDFLKPGKAVEPGVPAFLNPLPPNAPRNRLTFAQWLVDRQAPTTARSLVNRVWQSYFGTGIVSTSEDLGKQSDAPSHPELLDWLAVDFMEQGWSLKKLHKQIVMSATYQQSSQVTPELLEKDSANRLLARAPRLRVEAEIVRDIALAASGLLNPRVGGPSVYPPSPEFLYQPPVSYGPKIWKEEKGLARYRRAMYTFSYRSVPYPALQTFDAPNGDVSCVRRSRSNTPLQALTTLNEPLFIETARALAQAAMREGGKSDAERLTYAFRRVMTRTPEPKEATELLGLLERQKARYTGAGAHLGEVQAWTAVSRVLLNLDEAITKE